MLTHTAYTNRTFMQVPFTLTCNTPGRLRWVTTNIARFDPSVDWPTDLSCAFVWNKNLKTYDGGCEWHVMVAFQDNGEIGQP